MSLRCILTDHSYGGASTMARQFVHLHAHTEYSLSTQAIRKDHLYAVAVEYGMPVVATPSTSYVRGRGILRQCLFRGHQAHHRLRGSLDPEGHTHQGQKKYVPSSHPLFAENDVGTIQPREVSMSIANTDGFYGKPIDHSLLARYKSGLIASSACLAGEILSSSRVGEGSSPGSGTPCIM